MIFSGSYIPFGPYFPHLVLLPLTQLVTSRYPSSDTAIEAYHLAFCPRDPDIIFSTPARARPFLAAAVARAFHRNSTLTCTVPQIGFAPHVYSRSARAPLPKFLITTHAWSPPFR
eukprot:6172021-Pleurochrysis_carterae.AAC.2